MPPQPPYLGTVIIDEKLRRWINRHTAFATEVWMIGEVQFRTWQETGKDNYRVISQVAIGSEELKIVIRFTHHPEGGPEYPTDHAHVWGAHTIGSKRRRR